MKRFALFLPLLVAPLSAQWAVFDPTNYAVNTLIQKSQGFINFLIV